MKRLGLIAIILIAMVAPASAAIYEESGTAGTDSTGSGGVYHYSYINTAPHGQNYVFYGWCALDYRVNSNKYVSISTTVYDSEGQQSTACYIHGSDGIYSCSSSFSTSGTSLTDDGSGNEAKRTLYIGSSGTAYDAWWSMVIITGNNYTLSGDIGCIDELTLYFYNDSQWNLIIEENVTGDSSYSYDIVEGIDYRVVFDGAYYEFTCDGDEVFNYGACLWVYGYTCGIDTIKLHDSNVQLVETVYQAAGYDIYEMNIIDSEEYTISFYDQVSLLCHEQTFTSTGDHVLIDFDRCNWVYPPSPWGLPYIIYLWAGYDYNVVVFKDEHGNFIENSQLAIYDKTDGQYIQRWTDASDGYALLGAKFNTDHDVILSLRTFDGVFTLDTTYPANGSAAVGEEGITTTNWTVPIKYNLNVLPVDTYGASLFDVFCGLSEYTPLDPGSFWGMDLSNQGYVPVTNCSGFAMCDIIAEKDGYDDYKVEALNWTSKSALVKDYRHNVVMEANA